MGLNKKILDVTLAGSDATVYFPMNAISSTTFQITHPDTGTFVFSVSNSTSPVNIDNDAQMATIGWSDVQLSQPDGTKTYSIDLSDPQWASVCAPGIIGLDFQYGKIVVSGTGDYIVEQHYSSMTNYIRED